MITGEFNIQHNIIIIIYTATEITINDCGKRDLTNMYTVFIIEDIGTCTSVIEYASRVFVWFCHTQLSNYSVVICLHADSCMHPFS